MDKSLTRILKPLNSQSEKQYGVRLTISSSNLEVDKAPPSENLEVANSVPSDGGPMYFV